jgi:hypothetical protein
MPSKKKKIEEEKVVDPLSSSFEIEPIPKIETKLQELTNTFSSQEDADEEELATFGADYEFARKSVTNVVLDMEDKLQEVGLLAEQSQQPRAYEVYAIIAKAILDGNKDLLELGKRYKELKKGEPKQDQSSISTTNNNLFLTTGALNELLEKNGINSGIRTIEKE